MYNDGKVEAYSSDPDGHACGVGSYHFEPKPPPKEQGARLCGNSGVQYHRKDAITLMDELCDIAVKNGYNWTQHGTVNEADTNYGKNLLWQSTASFTPEGKHFEFLQDGKPGKNDNWNLGLQWEANLTYCNEGQSQVIFIDKPQGRAGFAEISKKNCTDIWTSVMDNCKWHTLNSHFFTSSLTA
jgi:hypothetical protein